MAATDLEEREARGARTQSLFRDVNERVQEINHAFSMALPLGEWVCECANDACSERIMMTIDEYESVRANARWFAVAPWDEHYFADIEDIVERTDRYWVVQKRGVAGELVDRVDPRRTRVPARAARV